MAVKYAVNDFTSGTTSLKPFEMGFDIAVGLSVRQSSISGSINNSSLDDPWVFVSLNKSIGTL